MKIKLDTNKYENKIQVYRQVIYISMQIDYNIYG